MTSNKLLKTVHETISRAHKAGVVNAVTMREFDQLCLVPTKEYSAMEIQEIRMRNKVSQAVLACYMNVALLLCNNGNAGTGSRKVLR